MIDSYRLAVLLETIANFTDIDFCQNCPCWENCKEGDCCQDVIYNWLHRKGAINND